MGDPLLQLVILGILLGPAYSRCPWLLALVGALGGAHFVAPQWADSLYALAAPFITAAILLTVAGYVLKVLVSAMELSRS